MPSENLVAGVVWIIGPTMALSSGYLIGKIGAVKRRVVALGAMLLAPLAILSAALISAPSSPPGAPHWWIVGLIMIVPAMLVWAMLLGAAYMIGRANVRYRPQADIRASLSAG